MKTFSGISEVSALNQKLDGASGMDFNGTRIQADEFKIPKKVQEAMKMKTFSEELNLIGNFGMKDPSQFRDLLEATGTCYGRIFETSGGKVIDLTSGIKRSKRMAPPGYAFRDGNNLTIFDINSQNNSFSMNNKNIKPTDKDLWEFNAWIKGRSKTKPRLRSRFQSDQEYEDFMIEAQDNKLNIENDPAIKGNSNKVHVSKRQEKRMSDSEGETKVFRGFGFDSLESNQTPTFGNLIGTLTLCQSYVHLFHYITFGQFPAHIALDDFYEEIGDEVDSLAEHILAFHDVEEFTNVILPGECPVDYLERLHAFCIRAKLELFKDPEDSGFVSQLDDISNEIAEAIYKLRRLKVGHKWFSTKSFSKKFKFEFFNREDKKVHKITISANTESEAKAKIFKKFPKASDIQLCFCEDKTFSDDPNMGAVHVKTSNPYGLQRVISAIGSLGNPGHSFTIRLDPDSEQMEDFSWDGDGNDRIGTITVDPIPFSPNTEFSKTKRFSEITSDEAFRKYAHAVMENAHGDNYSEEITNKVVDDLLATPHESYGELIGRLTSGLGN